MARARSRTLGVAWLLSRRPVVSILSPPTARSSSSSSSSSSSISGCCSVDVVVTTARAAQAQLARRPEASCSSHSVSYSYSSVRHVRAYITARRMSELDQFYEVVLDLVKQGGCLIRENISKQKTVLTKSCDVDLVTETDQMVEKLLMDGISAKFPDHKFIGEENTAESNHKVELTDAPTWIIDPVDGTMNFVHAMPHTCISIALYVNKVPEIGIVYNPVLEQFFSARRGQGAFYNGAQIRVSDVKELNKALVMMELGTSRDPEKVKVVMENLKIMTPLVHGTRALGSCALNMCMVAMGASDIMYEFGIHVWDVAAGDLIVREAGGVCIDPAGGDFDPLSRRVLCSSSMDVAQEVSKILIQYYPERD